MTPTDDASATRLLAGYRQAGERILRQPSSPEWWIEFTILPADPNGGDQPLLPTADGWSSRTGSTLYGQVKAAKDPSPALDGVVRWWLPRSYDG
ncbi:hypothetical protein [Nocardia carnea]|uniref:hypothetical protein n=1 Tax=Nocardia carnea TaxID=37328 RepID=UPI0024575423|nr:hypothetical protein [Nocardia carnea]